MGADEAIGQIEVLDRATCLALLRTVRIGRIAWSALSGEVAMHPVNFVLDGDNVVFKTSQGGSLDAVQQGLPLSFEADEVEPALRAGWSVLLVGEGDVITACDEIERLERLASASWAALPDPVFIRLTARRVTGRRLPLHPGGVIVERVV